ncbi:MAG: ATP-binding protein [Oscillospiraceae bacterium]|nr:ATP-binding protein [Oscillospiraceae bacterium]
MAYNSKVVQKVLGDFDNKYKTAAANAEKRKKDLYIKIPGLLDTDRKLSGTYKDIAGIILGSNSGGDFDLKISSVKKKNQDLIKKRKLLLEKAGYPENYTEPVYECAACEDTGYKNDIMCDCLRKALAAESINHSGLGRTIKNQTFENFNLNYYDRKKSADKLVNESPYKHMKSIYDECRKFAENFGKSIAPDASDNSSGNPVENAKNLMFIGSTGLGKTHLSSAAAYEVIKKGFDVFYDSAQSILYSFEKERFARGTFDPDIIERYMTCDLLIIDDLGTEYSGNIFVSSLYNLINVRLLESRSMIISTNLTVSEMQMRYDERIMSRIFGEFAILNFIGEDIRFKKL